MNIVKFAILAAGLSQLAIFCNISQYKRSTAPKYMLWAWERNEDLRFVNSESYGVAYLAQTVILTDSDLILHPRRQPLKVNPDAHLIAVTRIDSNRQTGKFSEAQLSEAVDLILKTSLPKSVKGIQIDYDVTVSERGFYKDLLNRIRPKLPKEKTLSITALASFCVGDLWLKDLPIDEAVPMLFEMGPDGRQISNRLKSGKDFVEPLCRSTYGLAIYEPHNIKFNQTRTRFYFNSEPWKPADLEKLK